MLVKPIMTKVPGPLSRVVAYMAVEDSFGLILNQQHNTQVGNIRIRSKRFKCFSNYLREHGHINCHICGRKPTHAVLTDARHTNGEVNIAIGACDQSGLFTMWTVDHVLPQALGGGNHKLNLWPACSDCNCRRGDNISKSELGYILANYEILRSGRTRDKGERVIKKTLNQLAHSYKMVERLT